MLQLRTESTIKNFCAEFDDIIRAFSPHLAVLSGADFFISVGFSAKGREVTILILANVELSSGAACAVYSAIATTVTVNGDIFAEEALGKNTSSDMRFNQPTQVEEVEITLTDEAVSQNLPLKKLLKHKSKQLLYGFISNSLGVALPYGSLTGIRPTKLYYELCDSYGQAEAESKLIYEYRVSQEKLSLITAIAKAQRGIYKCRLDKTDLFINIPVCPSRCSYCSFISIEKDKLRKGVLDKYVDCLVQELELFKTGYTGEDIRSIYIGGGTPTVLSAAQLNKLCTAISSIGFSGIEFTVEAGRPDTITAEKLNILKGCGVTRLSINPQSFSADTLARIGRKHTPQDVLDSYALAAHYGFSINMDLISSLPQESFEEFAHSLDVTLSLHPDNITVHTLAMKRGSALDGLGYDNLTAGETAKRMVDYSVNTLQAAGYKPYYMYRLKNMSGGLENVGYALPGKQCVYNVDIMEETHSVYAIGAGAISKRIMGDNLLLRFAGSKDLYFYLDNFDRLLREKKDFFGI